MTTVTHLAFSEKMKLKEFFKSEPQIRSPFSPQSRAARENFCVAKSILNDVQLREIGLELRETSRLLGGKSWEGNWIMDRSKSHGKKFKIARLFIFSCFLTHSLMPMHTSFCFCCSFS